MTWKESRRRTDGAIRVGELMVIGDKVNLSCGPARRPRHQPSYEARSADRAPSGRNDFIAQSVGAHSNRGPGRFCAVKMKSSSRCRKLHASRLCSLSAVPETAPRVLSHAPAEWAIRSPRRRAGSTRQELGRRQAMQRVQPRILPHSTAVVASGFPVCAAPDSISSPSTTTRGVAARQE